jgi:transcriptional regulator with PAS, ATPase and Fis domain
MITHCNQLGADLIRRSKQGIIGKHILKIWAGSPMLNVMKSGEGYDWREEVYQRGHANMHFMVSVKPVLSGAEIMGAVATFRDVADVRKKAYEIIAAVQRVGIDDIWGESPHARELKKKAALVARNNATVLITGETGTGKGLVANAIHHSGPRSPGPFISVNCGAIPENLLESELFGYNEGAFSGAMKGGKPGKFELAVGGSILLDEIGDMPLRLQPKLLHVLQAKVLERLGGLKQIPVDARVIASTNKNLEKMILENEFRQDLFFRLNVIPIHIPPLRDRKEDILLLLDKFMEKHCRLEDKEIKRVSSDVRELFLTYHWPGNIRELENTVQYMVSMETGTDIGMEQVPSRIKRERSDGSPAGVSLEASLESYEKDLLRRKLAEFGADKEKLADMMRVSRATLYRKLKKFGL